MFTVKEASEIMGISPHALRFYDNQGLFPKLARRNGRRFFSYDDLEWIRNIQCWRDSGMAVCEIKRYLELLRIGDDTLEERYKMILEQRDRAVEEAKAAKERVKILQRKILWYEALRRGDDAAAFRPNMPDLVQKAIKTKTPVNANWRKVCAGTTRAKANFGQERSGSY